MRWPVGAGQLLNTVRVNEDGRLRPHQWCGGIKIPIDGKAHTLCEANLEVLAEYGIQLDWLYQWCADNCNTARDVRIPPA